MTDKLLAPAISNGWMWDRNEIANRADVYGNPFVSCTAVSEQILPVFKLDLIGFEHAELLRKMQLLQ